MVEAEIVDDQVMFEYLSIMFFSFVLLKGCPFPFLDWKHGLCSYFRSTQFWSSNKKKLKMQIPLIGFDTLIGSGFEIDELEDDLGRRKFVSQFHFQS